MISLIERYYRRLAAKIKNSSTIGKPVLLDCYRIYKLSESIAQMQLNQARGTK